MATALAKAADSTETAADGTVTVEHAARIEHVSKSFAGPAGQQLVLDDITLDVAPGEFVTLLGASGCGKSTLLNLVAGLDAPDRGQHHDRRPPGPDVPGARPVPVADRGQEHRTRPETAGRAEGRAARRRPRSCWSWSG